MEVINGKSLSEMCDYSFGDHLGGLDPVHLPGGFMKLANSSNQEFLGKCKEFEGKIMTLFIDNIRLYNRPIWALEGNDAVWVKSLLENNDLLALCAMLPNNKFIIFTSHEDTPIDDQIKLPDNVLEVHATNCIYNNERVIPFPYGLQRPIERGDVPDNRISIMKSVVGGWKEPSKLLCINCGIERNSDREYLSSFEGLDWVTTRFNKDSMFFPYDKYIDFLSEIQDHKFMLCPQGHGIDCHRNWESLYLRRVPVMKKHPYFERLMAGFPVLFVNDWPEVTEQLLIENGHLFETARTMDLTKLDLKKIYTTIVEKYKNE